MLVSGSLAKIVDSGLLSKVCRSFVSDEGGKGVRGRGERSDGLPRWSWSYGSLMVYLHVDIHKAM